MFLKPTWLRNRRTDVRLFYEVLCGRPCPLQCSLHCCCITGGLMCGCCPRLCVASHVLCSVLYICAGAVQLIAGIFFLISLPVFKIGSNLWTGGWVSSYYYITTFYNVIVLVIQLLLQWIYLK